MLHLKSALTFDTMTAEDLLALGPALDLRPASLGGDTVAMALAGQLLCVRARSGETRPLRANPMQRLFESRRGSSNIVLKARQLGLTTWAAARFFLRTITRPGTLTLQVAHAQEAAEEIFRIVHRFYDWLPEDLRQGPLATSRANTRQIVFPELDSQYRVVTAGDRNAGRGLTVQNLHCSELARWPGDPADILAGLRAALAPGAEVILESTPQGVGGCFYDEWQKAHETGTVQHFFPWWLEPRYRSAAIDPATLTEEEQQLVSREQLDLEQIAFRRNIRANLRGLARQEFAEDPDSCFLSSGDSVFELSSVAARLATAPPPHETRHNGELEIWLPPVPGRSYLMAADPAGGLSDGDYSAAQVLDLATGMQCAEFAAHLGGLELARFLTDLAAEYNHALLVVERNNHGAGILALAETVCAYPRLYRPRNNHRAGDSNSQPRGWGLSSAGGEAGWLTTSVSRPAVLGRLDAALVEHPELFMSRRLLAECRSFVRHPDGSTAAANGAHDDRVLAMAIALAARAELMANRSEMK
ncbi:MAG TPA: hypothetical protein VG267_15345 [Terracidiphilus sp.]|jgi:hypothetical protein|nr:hypothetical protein [Terracidiphilus sp.]